MLSRSPSTERKRVFFQENKIVAGNANTFFTRNTLFTERATNKMAPFFFSRFYVFEYKFENTKNLSSLACKWGRKEKREEKETLDDPYFPLDDRYSLLDGKSIEIARRWKVRGGVGMEINPRTKGERQKIVPWRSAVQFPSWLRSRINLTQNMSPRVARGINDRGRRTTARGIR